MTTRSSLILDGKSLTLAALREWERQPTPVTLAPAAVAAMNAAVDSVRQVVARGDVSYGINTGFGAMATQVIDCEQLSALQYNLVRSHACGVGEALKEPVVRRIMLLKANSLAAGLSGIRPVVVETLLAFLAHGVTPIIPGRGSVGASGDLAPLAHLGLALIGEGEARHQGEILTGPAVLEAAGCKPVQLESKEGLAILNGTQPSTALALEGLFRADVLLASSVIIGALSVDGLAASYTPFDERIHSARGQRGQQRVAEHFRRLLTSSEIRDDHRDCGRVQDPYSLRCMPQVLGAVYDTLEHARGILQAEVNGVSDNPLIFGDEVLSGGNFHAQPVAMVADFMAIALTDLASMAERRIDLMMRKTNPKLNMFLANFPGLESGFMLAHVTAAALASENKVLAHPASVDSISTSAGQEDHVSMAPAAGHKLLAICQNASQVLAIEALAAARALDMERPLHSTERLEAVHAALRSVIPATDTDHRMDRDIAKVAEFINAEKLLPFLARVA